MTIDYQKEGRIAIFTINRPEARNVMNIEDSREFYKALVDFRDDPELWVGIITGAGDKAFCAGVDLKSKLPSEEGPPATLDTPLRAFDLWKPLIAAINGLALGLGMEIVLLCDIRIASEEARLGQPEVRWNILPGGGGTQRLPRMIPWCKAAELVLTGKLVDANEAYRIGLVNEVVAREEVVPKAKEWARTICQAGPLAVRAAKEAMLRGTNMTLEDGLQLEHALFESLVSTEDFIEGKRAFAEKRDPVYRGK